MATRFSVTTAALLGLLLLSILSQARVIPRSHSHHSHHRRHHHYRMRTAAAMGKAHSYYHDRKMMRSGTLEIAGSRLPDCSHSCGSCKPCRLVMVSFMCASLEEAETCPMAYKCMCKSKSYPVP
ncbi:hypothetical protein ACLOJK_020509 [Asimina triloba]